MDIENYKSPKIIGLEIEEFDEESGVNAIALVEMPAIESDWIFFSKNEPHKFESYNDYPDSVSNNAKKGIELNEKQNNKCATQVGKVRAQQLAKKEKISVDTIKRMYSYLSRAQVYYDEGDTTSCGYISYMLWGGLSARRWAAKKLKELGEFKKYFTQKFVENAGGFSIGDYVSWTYAGRGEGDDRGRGQIIDLRVSGTLKVPGTNFELKPTEERPAALIETRDGSVVGQYTENLRKIKKPEDFTKTEMEDYLSFYFELVDYIDGLPLFTTKEEAEKVADMIGCEGIHEHEIEGFVFYMPCETHDDATAKFLEEVAEVLKKKKKKKYIDDLPNDVQEEILNRLDELGESEEDLLKDGWVKIEDEQKFAISSEPNEPSIEDYGKFRIRYKYTGPKDSKNRTFCRRLLDKNLIFRKEDINRMTLSGENSQFGTYDIFTYKGSYGCRHFWTRVVYEKGDDNRERRTEQQSVDESSSVNPKPTMNRNPNSDTLISKDVEQSNFSKFESEEKKLIAGPLMIPRKLIYRYDDMNGEYYVYFTEKTIEKIAYKYLMNKYQDQTNLEHSEAIPLQDVVLVESWLVQDPNNDKSFALTGEKYEKGTWFGIMKVKNDSVWKEWVKTGRVKGFSVEGFFSDKLINASKTKFYYRTTEGGTEIVIDHETLVVFILKDGERSAILPDGTYELSNGKILKVVDSKAVEGSF